MPFANKSASKQTCVALGKHEHQQLSLQVGIYIGYLRTPEHIYPFMFSLCDTFSYNTYAISFWSK